MARSQSPSPEWKREGKPVRALRQPEVKRGDVLEVPRTAESQTPSSTQSKVLSCTESSGKYKPLFYKVCKPVCAQHCSFTEQKVTSRSVGKASTGPMCALGVPSEILGAKYYNKEVI